MRTKGGCLQIYPAQTGTPKTGLRYGFLQVLDSASCFLALWRYRSSSLWLESGSAPSFCAALQLFIHTPTSAFCSLGRSHSVSLVPVQTE